jgi:hypothetical protein
MKRALRSIVSVIAFASLLCLVTGSRAQATCSNASLKGTYAASCTGTVGLPGSPVLQAIVGVVTFDGEGGLSVKATLMQDGGPAVPLNVTGTYTVNADCTGSDVLAGSFHYDIALFDHKGGFFSIETDPGTQVTCVKQKQ